MLFGLRRMKCSNCGRYTTQIGDQKYFCKSCGLLYYFLIPNSPPKIFKMDVQQAKVA
ncbi:MAG: hypothetical protein GOP50_04450 [Candidatus Heimdallarchaeota archaeon]|nr:hypothetical protein [Candidatus Heimdallarchaeota archaeon]